MTNRAGRKNIAEDTLKILEDGYFKQVNGETQSIAELQKYAVENTKVYSPEESNQLILDRISSPATTPTKISVVHGTTLDITRKLIAEGNNDVLCLNFASAKNPGGGFLGGSQAQEESIARSTGLYPCQMKAWTYYEINRNSTSCFYTDYMIYSPKVPILKNEEGEICPEIMTTGIITAPAVNTGVVKRKEPNRVGEVKEVMKRRIAKVLAIALFNNHKSIVLGAWGCGVFQNDPVEIAQYFNEIIEADFKDEFREIVFAIYSRQEKFINAFYEEFGR